MADPKGLPQEVPLELHLKLTAWPLGHERAEFEVRKGSVPCRQFGLFFEVTKLAVELPLGRVPTKAANTYFCFARFWSGAAGYFCVA